MIRKSDGKADAAEKIMKRFDLDAEQTDAILELKIYRLARLRDSPHPKRARGKAETGPSDRRAAQRRRRPMETGPRRDRGDSEDLRRFEGRPTPHHPRERHRRARILRRMTSSSMKTTSSSFPATAGSKRQKEVKDLDHPTAREGDSVARAYCREALAPLVSSSRTSAWPTPAASSTCRHPPDTASRSSGSSSSRMAREGWSRP